MNPTDLIKEVREYINKGKLNRAFDILISWLEKAPKPLSSWSDVVRNLSSQYSELESKEIRNTISQDDASVASSQIKESLLNVLSAMAKGEGPVEKARPTVESGSAIPWIPIGVVLTLILAAASFFMLRKDHGPIVSPPDVGTDSTLVVDGTKGGKCPSFDRNSEFNIMVLPYKPLVGQAQNIGFTLQQRLFQMMGKYNINGDVLLRNIDVNSPKYPAGAKQAVPLGKPCKAQLIIWGTTEQQGDGEVTTITNFRFLDKDYFTLYGLELNPDAEVDTVSSISSIATSQILTEQIEESIALIFGLVAFETGNTELASEMLDEAVNERGGAAEVPNWGLLQAESKLRNGERTEAVAIYNEILEKNPEHTDARLRRANVYVSMNDLYQANVDIQQLEKNADMQKETKNLRKVYQVKRTEEVKRKEVAEEQLKTNPRDTSALRIQAQAARNLGQFEVANIAASSLLRYDPKNKIAITTLMEIRPMVKDTTAVIKKLENVQMYYNAAQLRNFDVRAIQNNN